MYKKNILIFPAGSEVGLEILRSIKYSPHFKTFGGSSIDDHGKFAFKNYIEKIPFYYEKNFIRELNKIVEKNEIDVIYPAMDSVDEKLKMHQNEINCSIVGSKLETTQICASKSKTYNFFKKLIPLPYQFNNISLVDEFPVFLKPDKGYGSKNTYVAKDKEDALHFLKKHIKKKKYLVLEYLPGDEYTIDCFTNRHGNLLFCGARKRARVSNGISVNTHIEKNNNEFFSNIAQIINKHLNLRGAWFYQMKADKKGSFKLLEIASRLGGSSALFRSQGVNFALLTLYDHCNLEVDILKNKFEPVMDRALSNRYKINIKYSKIYIDLDDCLVINGKINLQMIVLIFQALNKNIEVNLITKHTGNLSEFLAKHKINNLFCNIIHINENEEKHRYIDPVSSIFIDDSHSERVSVNKKHKIPVFSPDMIETLINI